MYNFLEVEKKQIIILGRELTGTVSEFQDFCFIILPLRISWKRSLLRVSTIPEDTGSGGNRFLETDKFNVVLTWPKITSPLH